LRLRARAGAAVLAAALALSACSARPALPVHTVGGGTGAAGPQIRIRATPVPLSSGSPRQDRIGAFVYAGGLQLTSTDTSRLHGLSDLKIWPDGRLLAVSDEGDLLEARLALDRRGRLLGLTQAALSPLPGEDGRPLLARGKTEADSEGIAELADGARLVSLECDDRILLYPVGGGLPRRVPSPDTVFPNNLGMEALAADPAAGADAYVVGGEASGQTWLCHLSSGCTASTVVALPDEAGLTAVAILPGGRRAYLLRAFSLLKGVRVTLRIVNADGTTLDEMRLAAPLTADNFEGLAAIPQSEGPRADGSIRFYLISDDNFSKLQRTLLLAFDWRPQPGRRP
jgi:hypothetical protein